MALIRRADAGDATRDALVLDLGDLARQGEAILRQARTRAASVIESAQKERDRLIADARQVGTLQGIEEGKREGLAKGAEEGAAKAIAQTKAQVATLVASWDAALAQFSSQRESMLIQARQDVLALALEIASRVTRRQIAADPRAVEPALEAALSLVMRPTRARLAVSPEDEALARQLLPELVERVGRARDVELVADPAVERGGCILRTEGGASVDANVQTQLDRIVEALLPSSEAP